MPDKQESPGSQRVHTDGGAYLRGEVNVRDGATFVGRDQYITHVHITYLAQGDQPQDQGIVPGAPLQTEDIEPKMVYIEPGSFLMGSPPGVDVPEHETPQHKVSLPGYYIGKYPVTNEQYWLFCRETNHSGSQPIGWEGRTPPRSKLDHPVSGVTWYDALAFCQWLWERTRNHRRYALPTEAEWEKAARGTSGWVYPWGNEWEPGQCNFGSLDIAPITAYPQGQSPYGCYDMVGNVREWTSSLWGQRIAQPEPGFYYPWANDWHRNDLQAGKQVLRVYRGGAYNDPVAQLRCSARNARNPSKTGDRGKRCGFRVVLRLRDKCSGARGPGGITSAGHQALKRKGNSCPSQTYRAGG